MNFSLFFLRLFSIFGKCLIGNVNLGNLGKTLLDLNYSEYQLKSVEWHGFCQIYELRCFKSTLIRKNYVLKNVFS